MRKRPSGLLVADNSGGTAPPGTVGAKCLRVICAAPIGSDVPARSTIPSTAPFTLCDLTCGTFERTATIIRPMNLFIGWLLERIVGKRIGQISRVGKVQAELDAYCMRPM